MEIGVLSPIVKYLLKYETIGNSKAQEITGKGVESIKNI